MTPVFICGMECRYYGFEAAAAGHWYTTGASAAEVDTTTIRPGLSRASARISPINSNESIIRDLSTTPNLAVISAYIRFSTLPDGNCIIMGFNTASVGYLGAYFDFTTKEIRAGRGNVGSTPGGVVITTGVWYKIDVRVNVSSNPHQTEVAVDGTRVPKYTNSNSSTTLTLIRIGTHTGSRTFTMNVDDFVLSFTAADFPIPPYTIGDLRPIADGSHNIVGANDFERTETGTDILNSTTDAYLLVNNDFGNIYTTFSGGAQGWINMKVPGVNDYVEVLLGFLANTPKRGPSFIQMSAELATDSAGGSPKMDISLRLVDNATENAIYEDTSFYTATVGVLIDKIYSSAPSGVDWNINNDDGNGDVFNLKVRFGTFDAADANPDGWFGLVLGELLVFEEPIGNINQINQTIKRASYY